MKMSLFSGKLQAPKLHFENASPSMARPVRLPDVPEGIDIAAGPE
jgi:hypothetical protein